MEEREFRRLLDLFPVIRSRDYCFQDEYKSASSSHSAQEEFQDESKSASSSHSAQEEVTEWQKAWSEMDKMDELKENESEDAFWRKLRAAAERKIGPSNAERFCSIFKTVHKKLVYEHLTLEAAQSFVATTEN